MVEVERGDLTRKYKIGGNANMANLKDVEVIDMKDGNVTKIEHDGKEYEKVSEGTSPKKGDIGLRVKVSLPHMMDVTEGEYYEINMGAGDYENRGEVGYVDDEGDSVFTSYETDFIYFRENSDYSEMSKDGLSVGDTVILDAGDAADEYPLHGFYNGEEYEVTNLHPDHGVEGVIRIEGGSAYGFGYALPSQLRKKGDFKEGDRVRINIPEGKTPEYTWGAASNGDVGTVVEVCEHKVVVNFPKQSYWNALPSELEMITEEEYEEEAAEIPFKPGDIVEVTGRTRFEDIKVGTKARVAFHGPDGDGEYRIDLLDGSDHDYVLPENIKLLGQSEFKVGDKAKVIGKTYFSDIDEGTTVVITEEQDRAGDYRIDLLDESDFDYAQPESLEPIAEKDGDLVTNVELGDLIRVTDCKGFYSEGDIPTEGYSGWGEGGQGLVAIGSIGKVKSVNTSGVRVEFSRNTTKTRSKKEGVQLSDFFLRHGEFEVVEEYPGHTAEKGDKVYVTDAWITSVKYYDGDVFTVSDRFDSDAFHVEEHSGVVATKEVVVVEKADKAEEDAATDGLESLIGKYVVFSDSDFQSDLITGKYYEIVDICEVDKDGFYVVDETGDRQFVFQDVNKSRFTYEVHDVNPAQNIEVGDLVEVVRSPLAQPEGTRFVVAGCGEGFQGKYVIFDNKYYVYDPKKHVKLIEKAGDIKSERNSGEIRLGDIVRVDNDVVSYHNEGDIGIVTEYENNGKFRVETPTLDHVNWVGSEDVTLLAKAEDRADDHEYA